MVLAFFPIRPIRKERVYEFGLVCSLVSAHSWLGTALGVRDIKTRDSWPSLLRLASDTAVSSFSLHSHLLGADSAWRFLDCGLRDAYPDGAQASALISTPSGDADRSEVYTLKGGETELESAKKIIKHNTRQSN